jgi:prophage tail gpP-like protein
MATDDDTLTLKTGGEEHRGWTGVTLSRGLEQASAEFSVALTRTKDAQTVDPINVRAGESVELTIGDDVILSGWVYIIDAVEEGESYAFTVEGRSKTSDLVDCSAAPAQFKRLTFGRIAGALASDYNVDVVDNAAATKTYQRWRTEPGETVFMALDRLARDAQVLLTDDANGALVIEAVGTTRGVDITEDIGIIREHLRVDASQRFSVYEVRGQAVGDDANYGTTSAHGFAEVDDDGNWTRERRLEIRAESGFGYSAACKARAINEAVTRAGRSISYDIDVPGWRQPDGTLWWTNILHRVKRPRLRLDGDMVLADLSFTADARRGKRAHLTFLPPGTFEFVEPTKRPRRKGKIAKVGDLWFTSGDVASIVAGVEKRLGEATQ